MPLSDCLRIIKRSNNLPSRPNLTVYVITCFYGGLITCFFKTVTMFKFFDWNEQARKLIGQNFVGFEFSYLFFKPIFSIHHCHFSFAPTPVFSGEIKVDFLTVGSYWSNSSGINEHHPHCVNAGIVISLWIIAIKFIFGSRFNVVENFFLSIYYHFFIIQTFMILATQFAGWW